jgi:hypothetical protein
MAKTVRNPAGVVPQARGIQYISFSLLFIVLLTLYVHCSSCIYLGRYGDSNHFDSLEYFSGQSVCSKGSVEIQQDDALLTLMR